MRMPVLIAVLVALTSAATRAADDVPADRFLERAAARSLAGLELSELALQRSESPAVRRLARRAVDEHAATYESILGLATGAGVTASPPSTLDLEHRGIKARLAGLRGSAFDRAYVDALRTNDDRDIALYRGFARTSPSEALGSWVATQLATIRKRRQLIEVTAREIAQAR
jgi:putative membrane protein